MQSINDFKEVVTLLRKFGIEIWADLGALLGFTREGYLLEWEEDIDCGTLATRKDFATAENYLEQHGWKMFDKYKGLAIQNKNCTTKIDIKFYKEEEDFVYAYFVVYKHKFVLPICDMIIWFMSGYPASYKYETVFSKDGLKVIEGISNALPHPIPLFLSKLAEKTYFAFGLTGYKIKFPRSWVLPLCVQKVGDFPFRIPSCPEKILELTYGKNWKKPLQIVPGTDRYTDGSSRYLTVRVKEQRPELVEVAT